jgi:multisubunit Na+/H+ antiporter MnhC subunit
MSLDRQHSFWGSLSPLGGLSGAGLLVMASARLSWAVIVAGSLFWVYGLTTSVFAFLCSEVNPKVFPVEGRGYVFTCIASFFGGMYLLLLWLLCPMAAFETFFLLIIIPLFCASSGVFEQIASPPENTNSDITTEVSDALSQAAVLAGLIIAFSVIREPLSYCSLSLPGSAEGLITIMYFKSNSFFPMGIFAASSGALLLLGYIICLYQYGKNAITGGGIK